MTDSYASTSGPLVYVIQSTERGPIKIGATKDIERRLAQLQTGSPIKLTIMGWFPCANMDSAFSLEANLHNILAPYRMVGEWFGFCAFPAIACRQGFTINGNAETLSLLDMPKKQKHIRPDWCSQYVYGKFMQIMKMTRGKKADRYNPAGKMTPAIESVHDYLRGIAGANDDSISSAIVFFQMKISPPLWSDFEVTKDGFIRAIWKGLRGAFITIEFINGESVICDIEVRHAKARSVNLQLLDAAVYLKIVKKKPCR